MVRILVLTGASGGGKTTLLRGLAQMALEGVLCVECDTVYASLPPELLEDPEAAQDALLDYGLRTAHANPTARVAVLATQIRPHRAIALLEREAIAMREVVLVECEQSVREARLRGLRQQPELANPRMECWAAYLRGQADALGLPIIDTSADSLADSAARVRQMITALLERN